MGTLADFRRQYPQYDDMSDVELAEALHKKYYSDLPKADVFKKLAVKPTAPTRAPADAVPMDAAAPTRAPARPPAPVRTPKASAEIAKRTKELDESAASLSRMIAETQRLSKLPGATAGMREKANIAIEEYRKTLGNIKGEKDYMQRTGTLVPERSFGDIAVDTLKGFGAGALRTVAGIPSILGAVGIEGPGKASEEAAEGFIQRNLAPDESDAAKFGTLAQQGRRLSEVAGSVLPAFATRGASRAGMAVAGPRAVPVLTRTEQAAQLALGAGPGAQQQRQAIEQYEAETGKAVNPVVRAFAQAAGAAIGATEVLTLDAMMARVPSSLRGSMTAKLAGLVERVEVGGMSPKAAAAEARALVADLQRTARGRVGVAALEEGTQEAGAQLAQNVLERAAYNPDKDITEGLGENFTYGAIVGGGVRGLAEVARKATGKAKAQGVDPAAVMAEFHRVAAEQIDRVMKANPGMKQNDAAKLVEENAEALFNLATANVVSGTKGVLDVDTGMDVGGGSGTSTTPDLGTTPPISGVADVGKTVGGGLGRSVPSVPVSTDGTPTGERPLTKPTAAQVKATVPIIEQAFEASALDFVDAYESVLGKNNKLNAEQKKQAARIVIQSPEVDPYDAIGSVLDRGLQLRGEKAPSTSGTTVTGPPNAQELQDKLVGDIAAINAQADAEKAAIQAQPTVTETATVEKVTPTPEADVQETVQAEAAPASTPVELVPYKDVAMSAMWYKGGSQTAVAGTEKPAWVPDDVKEYDIPGRPRPTGDKSDARVEQFTAKDGTVGTKVSVIVPTIDEVYGDRGNVAAATLWLRDADPEDIDSAIQTAETVARWVADPNNSKAADGPLNQIADRAISFITKQGATTKSAPTTEAEVDPAVLKERDKLREKIIAAPGDTIRQKIIGLMSKETNEALKNAKTPEELAKLLGLDETSPIMDEVLRGEAGIDDERMKDILRKLYQGAPDQMAHVCVKEVLQNSHDAVRDALRMGLITEGAISFKVSEDGLTFTTTDNGKGMSPQVLQGPFLKVGSTGKGADGESHSGGYGLAKTLFLYGNKAIKVITANNGIISTMETSGEQLGKAFVTRDPNDQPLIYTRPFEPDDYAIFPEGHGTKLTLTLPSQDIDPESGNLVDVKPLPDYPATSSLPGMGHSPLFSPVNVTYQKEGDTYYRVDIGSRFPYADFAEFAQVKLPSGTAVIYASRQPKKYAGSSDNVHILSDGVWQFSKGINVPGSYWDKIPYDFYINYIADPSVKPDNPLYPFTMDRKTFSSAGEKTYSNLATILLNNYGLEDIYKEVVSFGTIQYFDPNTQTLGNIIDLTPEIPEIETGFGKLQGGAEIVLGSDGRVAINGQNIDPEDIADISKNLPKASSLIIDQSKIDPNKVMVHENADVEYTDANGETQQKPIMEFLRETFGTKVDEFYYFMGDAFQQLRGEVADVMNYPALKTEAVGISVDPGYRGVSIKVPFSGMFINPLVPEAPAGPRALFGIVTTMIHELAHYQVRNHDAGFPAEMQRIQAALEAAAYEQGFDFPAWKQRFVDRAIDAGYVDLIRAGQQLFETRKDRESYTYGNPEYKNIRVVYRGQRFKDGAAEQVPDEGRTGPDGTANNGEVGGGTGTGERLLGPAYERRGRTGKRGDLGTGEGGTEPLTDANVEKAVSIKLTKAQIKRLEAAAGIRGMEVNQLQKRIIQSRNENETKGLIKRLTAAIKDPDANSGIIASLTQSMPVGVYRFVLGFQQIEDIFRLAKLAGMKSIGKIDTMMREGYIPYVNRIVRRASDLEQKWTAFASRNPEGNTTLDDVIMYSNMLDADPSLAVTAAEYMRIDPKLKELEGKLATEANPSKQKSLKGQITNRKNDIKRLYFGGELKDENGDPVLDDDKKPVVVQGWNKLPPEGKQIFKAARDFHRANFNEHYRLLMQRIDDAKFDSNDAVKLKSSIEQMFNKARERTIYFPVKRFGEYWLSVGNDFYMRESAKEIKNLANRLKKEGETRAMVPGTSRADLRNKVASNDASAALKGILDALDGRNTKGEPKVQAGDVEGLRDLIFQMYLTALPEADMRRRFVHRRFVTGFSTDSLRTFAATAVASANQLGRLAYNYKFQNVLEEAKAESESDELTPYRDALRLEIADRVSSAMTPNKENWADLIIAFGSKITFYHHLSSAASAAINLLQLHTLGLPVLSGEFGEAKTVAMAARYTTSLLAGREIPNPFRDEDGNVALQAPDFKFENSGYMRSLKKSDPERYKQTLAAWEYAQDHDVIESTFASSSQLYERSNTPTGDFNFRQAVRRGKVLTAGQRAAANAMSAMGFMFHTTETIGRSVMYMSTFDLAYERAIGKGKTPEQAGIEARNLATELTNKAMFDFTNWNKSRFAQARLGRFALQMTSYIHSLISLMLRSFVGMLPYFNKEGKAAAARVFFGSSGITALYGGFQATLFSPLIMGAYTVAKYVESLLEDDDDEEEEAKQGYLNEKTFERNFLKYADEKGNELGKKNMDYYIRATFIPETFGKGGTLQKAFGLSDKAAANLATAADSGIPAIFGVDISNSVAMGDLPFIGSNVELKGDTPEVRALEGTTRLALGPFGSVGISYVKAIYALNDGDIQQFMELVVPAAIRNPLKAQRLQEEGLKIGKDKDIQLKDPSYYTGGKALLISLGFKDTETTRNMELDMMAGEVEREVAAQKTELLDRRYRAILALEKNPSAENKKKLDEVERDMEVYSFNYPSNAISEDAKLKSFQAKAADALDKEYGLGVNPKIPIREATQEERIEQLVRDSGQ